VSALKKLIRSAARFYLTNTPIKKGRYPLMMLVHKLADEPITVEVETKDRGRMVLDLQDEAQFPLFYNIYEWKDTPTLVTLASGSDVILDIGGNIGQMAMLFARYAKKVYTFEPIPEKGDRLQQQINLNDLQSKVTLSRLALSEHPGKLQFAMPTDDNGGIGSTVIRKDRPSRIIEVEAETLDNFLDQNGVTNVDFIKMDIEGGELFALKGMSKLLSGQRKPIVVLEMTISMMQPAGYGPKEILDVMSGYGYECYAFERNGLSGPHTTVNPQSENYCFLTKAHVAKTHIANIIH
jgi:FkbM family methyltransferase